MNDTQTQQERGKKETEKEITRIEMGIRTTPSELGHVFCGIETKASFKRAHFPSPLAPLGRDSRPPTVFLSFSHLHVGVCHLPICVLDVDDCYAGMIASMLYRLFFVFVLAHEGEEEEEEEEEEGSAA